MAKRGNKKLTTYAILGAGALAVGGIVYYTLSSGMLAGGAPEPAIEPAPAAPQEIPGITDYPTLTETLNAPAPMLPSETPPTTTKTKKPVTTTTPTLPKCPAGFTGTYPDCIAPVPTYKCPTGWTGQYPNCNPPATTVPTCPVGWSGAYPNCIPPTPKCPTGWSGTYPACVPPTPTPTPTPKPSTCRANPTVCKNQYYGKCNTECKNPTSSVCKACRCACEGVSSSLALAFVGSRVSDDGVEDRAYYVTPMLGW